MTPTRFPDAPPQIARLPVSDKGFPVPWFVPWLNGKPDFRAVHPARILEAHTKGLCWICGGRMGSVKVFAVGPMCCVNRVSAEPPSHKACAVFAVEACPFLSRPLAKRVDISDLGIGPVPAAGIMLEHNPGVTALWTTQTYRFERELERREMTVGLFHFGAPTRVEWYREGRPATQAEVVDGITAGLPNLVEMARRDERQHPGSLAQLEAMTARLLKLIPQEAANA